MVRLLVVNDIHYRGTNPRARTDDFPAAIERKLREIFELARSNECDAIVIGGDIVDTPGIALPTLVELCLILASSPCPLCAVPGNHDLWSGSPETVARTPYGALTRLGLIHDLSTSSYVIDCVSLTGHGYDAQTDRDISQYTSSGYRSPHVHVAHGMLLQREPGHVLARYTLASDVAALEDAPDVLIVGHEHSGFGVMRIGHTTFVNPGALSRLSASSVEISRQVRVCLVSIFTEDRTETGPLQIDVDLVPVRSARPGHEVLSRSHLEERVDRQADAGDFVALLRVGETANRLEIRQIIEEVAEVQKVPQEVLTEALRRVGEASAAID